MPGVLNFIEFEYIRTSLFRDFIMSQGSLKCEACDKTFSGPAPLREHLASKKHKKKERNYRILNSLPLNDDENKEINAQINVVNITVVNRVEKPPDDIRVNFRCSICDIICNSKEQYDSHISGAPHKKREHQNGLLPAASDSIAVPGTSNPVAANSSFRCDICNIVCTGIQPYTSHLESQKHHKKVKARELQHISVTSSMSLGSPIVLPARPPTGDNQLSENNSEVSMISAGSSDTSSSSTILGTTINTTATSSSFNDALRFDRCVISNPRSLNIKVIEVNEPFTYE